MRTLIKSIYHGSTNEYQDYHYKLTRGIKEGCPLSPSLSVLVYETFHATLSAEFPDVHFFVYVDDIAVVAPNVHILRRVFQRVDTLSPTVGFKVRDKTELYHWSVKPQHAAVQWGRDTIQMKAPAFKYLGHYPAYQAGVHADILSRAQADVARFGHPPLSNFMRAQLLNSVLIPQWVYHSLLVPDDRLFHQLQKVSKIFVLFAKGMDKIHNTTHTTSPKGARGMGLHQVFWAYRARYITVMQDILRGPNLTQHMSKNPVPRNVTTLCNYVHAIQQLRAYTTVTTSHQQTRPCGGPSVLDEESEDDALFWKTKEKVVGREEYTRKYVCPDATQPTPEEGQIPPGFVPCAINGIPCYHNQKQRNGTAWHSDGSKLSGSHRCATSRGGSNVWPTTDH